jgi:hypothetical protein
MLADQEGMAALERNIAKELDRKGRDTSTRRSTPRPPLDRDVPSSGFYLYRLWGVDGRLLYIGVSTRLSARLRVHRSRWGDLIHHVTWDEHVDEGSMLAAERKAITDEDPAFNKAGIG